MGCAPPVGRSTRLPPLSLLTLDIPARTILRHNPLRKTIVFNSIAWLTSQATILVVSVLQSVVVSRILGPELRGVFYVFSNGLVLLVTFVNLGIGTANVVFVAKRTYSVAEVFTNSVLWACGLGLTLAVLFATWPDLLIQSVFKNVPYWWVWVAVG